MFSLSLLFQQTLVLHLHNGSINRYLALSLSTCYPLFPGSSMDTSSKESPKIVFTFYFFYKSPKSTLVDQADGLHENELCK